jgi:hypothetical protein
MRRYAAWRSDPITPSSASQHLESHERNIKVSGEPRNVAHVTKVRHFRVPGRVEG